MHYDYMIISANDSPNQQNFEKIKSKKKCQ